MTPIQEVVMKFNMSTNNMWAAYQPCFFQACDYADQTFQGKFGAGIMMVPDKLDIWLEYFKDCMLMNGVPNTCVSALADTAKNHFRAYFQ